MKRTMNVLLTLAVVISLISFAYYLTEILIALTSEARPAPSYDFEVPDHRGQLAKVLTYWLLGFIGLYVCGRVFRKQSLSLIALMIGFGYLLILGSHGGLSIEGSYYLKAGLSAVNVAIFTYGYVRFERAQYPEMKSA